MHASQELTKDACPKQHVKAYEGEHRWMARDRTVIATVEQNRNESDNMKVEIEELELLLGPEDSEVDLRFVVMNAKRKKGRRISRIFSVQCQSSWFSARRDWKEIRRKAATSGIV